MENDKTDDRREQPPSQATRKAVKSQEKKFIPTCKICGEKHWPHHALIPCLNKQKAKAKAKAERKAKAEAKKRAKVEARARAEAEARENAEAQARAKAEKKAYADALAEAIDRVLNDTELRNEMVRKGLSRARTFCWEDTARKTLAVYEEVAKSS